MGVKCPFLLSHVAHVLREHRSQLLERGHDFRIILVLGDVHRIGAAVHDGLLNLRVLERLSQLGVLHDLRQDVLRLLSLIHI